MSLDVVVSIQGVAVPDMGRGIPKGAGDYKEDCEVILGFKNQFVPFVLDGSKTHTIRAGNRWRAGMRADLFSNVRQKNMRLIFRVPVVRVQEIQILKDQRIIIDGEELDEKERALFAWRDGFRPEGSSESFPSMMAFWNGRLPFAGQIIYWDYAARFTDITETCFRESARRAMAARKVLL